MTVWPTRSSAVLHEEPRPIAELNPRIPAPFRWIVERCLPRMPASATRRPTIWRASCGGFAIDWSEALADPQAIEAALRAGGDHRPPCGGRRSG